MIRARVHLPRTSDPHLTLAEHRVRDSEYGKEGSPDDRIDHGPGDEEIQRDVVAELRWDARMAPNEIGVMVTNRVVTLIGWVDSYRSGALGGAAYRAAPGPQRE